MHCNGHCQLHKKLADTDQQNSPIPMQKDSEEVTITLFHPITLSLSIQKWDAVTIPMNGYYTSLSPQTFIRSIFHPPSV